MNAGYPPYLTGFLVSLIGMCLGLGFYISKVIEQNEKLWTKTEGEFNRETKSVSRAIRYLVLSAVPILSASAYVLIHDKATVTGFVFMASVCVSFWFVTAGGFGNQYDK